MKNNNGVSYKKFRNHALEDSVIPVWVAMKIYSNAVAIALVGLLPKEAQLPSESERERFGLEINKLCSGSKTAEWLANFTNSPVDFIICIACPGVTVEQAIEEIFN